MNYLRKISTNLVGLLIFSIILLNGLPKVYAEEESPGSAEIRVESATPSESSGESGQQNSSTEPAKEKSQESDKKSETGEVSDNNTNPLKAGKEKSQTEKKDSTNGQENGEKPEKDSEKADLSEEIKPVPLGNPSQTPKAFTVKKRGAEGTEEIIVGEFDKFYDAVGSMDNNGKDGFYTIYVNRDVTVPADEMGGYYRSNNKFRITSGQNVSSVLKREGEWGILAIQENSELTIDNITLDGSGTCQCLFISNNGKVTIGNGATIQNFVDTDKESGPAIHVTGGTLNILPGATIQNNNSNTQGGVIQAYNGTTVNISGGTFSNNESNTSDGGFLAAYGELNITGGKFENNKAKKSGGAILVGSRATASIENATFNDNKASTGGAIHSSGKLEIKDLKFNNNKAEKGGAVYSEQKLIVTNGIFENNVASSQGGAMYLKGESTLNGVKTDDNQLFVKFSNNSSKFGGAIYGEDSLKLKNVIFDKNNATKNGGALFLYKGANIENSKFVENKAGSQGGAIDNRNEKLTISHSYFNQNICMIFGGAIIVKNSHLIIKNTNFTNNISNKHGGALCMDGLKEYSIENTIFEKNAAAEYGGAIISFNGGSLKFNGAKINNNFAPRGAGVVVNDGSADIKASEFNGNDTGEGEDQEQRLGGGLYIGEDANVNISQNTKFIDNKAGMGGAIFTEDWYYNDPADTNKYKNLTIEDTTLFKGNIARAGLFYPPNNFKEFNNLNFSSDSDVKQNVGNRPSLLNNNDINYKSNTSRVTFINDDKVYKVVFVQNGKSINSDDLIDESMPANPTKAGYTFENWNEKKDGKGENFNDATIVNGDRLVYAIYKKNPPKPSDDRPGPVPDYRPDEKTEIPDDIKEVDPGLKQDDSPIEKEKEKPNEKEAENTPPVLEVKDGAIIVGEKFDPRTLITRAYDKEDGSNLVDSVIIDQGKFDNRVAGRYEIQYSLIDKSGSKVTKLAYVDVLAKANKENLRNSRENPKTGVEPGFALYSTIILLSSSAYTAIRKKY
ncbi:InlB B-repeat-containing protein [Anaerococcus degeneri]|uniref:InlB B-repeat-containing protein n=1 Tax=Anaerococcus degeneri TaxID=361500 RepID=A0ABS7YX90_9FIRM|nr:InlB B-repeat-containing protein [Anaerococcus degeneri]MBP2015920.1 putative repeat protein (TIGR02543 family) [Anaerococcus degeneri]MCA2095669.1 InlB B-repeat-containing protein [Anaerococcus degeneri]